jgi:2',3'-cyclic-nucleotide 2'-phosphodiesterase (5'-nucleotidase family)
LPKLRATNLRNKIFTLLVCLILSACTYNKVSKGVYTDSNWTEENYNPKEFIKLHIASTNNFSGHFSGNKEVVSFSDRSFNDDINVGGLAVLESYFDILRKRYGENLVLLDGGNFFLPKSEPQKEVNWTKIQSSLKALERIPFDGLLFTQYDLNLFNDSKYFKNEAIKKNFISTNIYNLGGGQRKYLEQVQNLKIIRKDALKIAVLGLNTYTPNSPTVAGHLIEDPVLSYLKLKQNLSKEKVDMKIVLLNINSSCLTREIGKTTCQKEEEDDLKKLLNRFPPQDIDLVVLSGHSFIYDFISGIPVLQNPGEGRFLSRLTMFYHIKNKKIAEDKTSFHLPVKLCEQFYVSTSDCDTQSEKDKKRFIREDNFRTVPAKFLGHEVKVSEDNKITY